ncbi:hypothetical protein CRG98_041855 [Punica granatum]|uniref:Uncharacterized protein n=1 Tax=Punica granatum TaxID=22663 RepID=A0A2I0I1A3_PUNGR|nr:hypothetical protein CRG98_041855 [Punica granatum]
MAWRAYHNCDAYWAKILEGLQVIRKEVSPTDLWLLGLFEMKDEEKVDLGKNIYSYHSRKEVEETGTGRRDVAPAEKWEKLEGHGDIKIHLLQDIGNNYGLILF